MTDIRVGIVGCGGRGRGHMRVLHTFDDVELTAVCDPFASSRDQAGEEFGVAGRYETVEAMLDAEDLDAAGAMSVLMRDAIMPNLMQTFYLN